MTRPWKLRAVVLVAVGAYAVHQLRYVLAYGSRSSEELGLQGHHYLTLVAPALAGSLLAIVAGFCLSLI